MVGFMFAQDCDTHADCAGTSWCYSNGDGDSYCVPSDWQFCANNNCYEGDGDCDCGGDCTVIVDGQFVNSECVGNLECVQYGAADSCVECTYDVLPDGGLGFDVDICECTLGYDCAGDCGGAAEIDNFGLCGNNNSLQGAIDAADAGGVLDVPAGEYTGPFTIDKSLTLNGAGQDAVFIQNADLSADVVKICYSSGDACDVTIQNVTIRNGRYGIYSKSTGSVNILNNTFYHNGYDGETLPDPDSATAQADHAALWASGHTSSGGAMRIRNSNGSEIAGNTVRDNLRGIRFQDSHGGSIHDNASYNNFEAGIYLAAGSYTGATGCSNTNVFDNEVYGNRNNGLLSIGGIGNTFTNNNVHDNWNSGVMMWHVADNTFSGNTISGNNIYSFNGIGNNGDAYSAVTSKGATVDAGASYNFILTGNTISNNGNGNQSTSIGVLVDDGLLSTTVSGNTFSGQDTDVSYGDSTTASGNTCSAGCDCNSGSVADCAGVCGGSTTVDECGECGGSGIPANSSIRANDLYVASTGISLGADGGSSEYHEDGGFEIATTFQVNLEYQAGVDPDAVDHFNNYGEGTVHNWTDPQYYFMAISEAGGLAAWSYGDNNLEEDLNADLQWTVTGWGQTIWGGTIEDGRLVVTTGYRPFDATEMVNDVEVFSGVRNMELLAYTFNGAASDIGAGTQLGVELRVDECDCAGNFADCAGVCDGSATDVSCWDGEVVCSDTDCSDTPQNYPSWSLNIPVSLEFNGSVTASVDIEDIVADAGDMIGAFVNGAIRGVGTPLFFSPTGTWSFATMIFSSVSSGEIVAFQFYDSETDEIIPLEETIPFEGDMTIGNAQLPFVFTRAKVTTDISIESGWNWFSINVESDDMSLNNVLGSIGSSATYIKNQDNYADYYDDIDPETGEEFGWFGLLENFGNAEMYKLNSLDDANIAFAGFPVNPASVNIGLEAGWNWVGYTPQSPMDINTGLASIGNIGIYVKNRVLFSDYYNDFGYWFGILETLVPYEGYMLNTNGSGTLTYPSDVVSSFDPSDDVINEILSRNVDIWNVKSSDFEFNGSITAEVRLGDNEVSVGDMLAAFDGNECRGVAYAVSNPFGDHLVFPLMVYGNDENISMSFKYYDSLSGEVINITEKILFESDMALGNAIETVVLNSESSVLVSQFELKSAYPNPFNPSTTLDYSIDVAGDINISILDINGRLVEVLYNGFGDVGHDIIKWDASYNSSGVYFVKLISGNKVQIQKIVLLK